MTRELDILSKKAFYYWIKFTFNDNENSDTVIELGSARDVLSKLKPTVRSDYLYNLADVIIDKTDKVRASSEHFLYNESMYLRIKY